MIKLATHLRVALVVKFVGGEKFHVRPQFASVQGVLTIFDLDIFLPRLNYRSARIRSGEAFV